MGDAPQPTPEEREAIRKRLARKWCVPSKLSSKVEWLRTSEQEPLVGHGVLAVVNWTATRGVVFAWYVGQGRGWTNMWGDPRPAPEMWAYLPNAPEDWERPPLPEVERWQEGDRKVEKEHPRWLEPRVPGRPRR